MSIVNPGERIPARDGFGWNRGETEGKPTFTPGSWLGRRTAIMAIPEPRLMIRRVLEFGRIPPRQMLEQILKIYL